MRKEEILALIEEFARKLAVQPEVLEAIHSDLPLWQRMIIPDMVNAFETALRDEIPVTMPR